MRYRGATSFAVPRRRDAAGADACLLFSDGLVTIDRREGFRPDCPLFALSSARDADRAWLGALARAAGGEAFDLGVRPADEVLGPADPARAARPGRAHGRRRASNTACSTAARMAGGSSDRCRGAATSSCASPACPKAAAERIYAARGRDGDGDGPGALWAAERSPCSRRATSAAATTSSLSPAAISVASPDVSFIVLENGRDYAQAKIEPPADAPEEWRETIGKSARRWPQQEAGQRAGRLETILGQWREMRTWYDTRFMPARAASRGEGGRDIDVPVRCRPPPPPLPTPQSPQRADGAERRGDGDADAPPESRLPTCRSLRCGQADEAGQVGRSRGGTIALEPWKPDRPYLRALRRRRRPATRERVFAEQQREHGDLPAFWLDVADWAWRSGRRADAIACVLSALELPTRNSQTLAIVADRLLRYGETDRAIWLLERLLAAEDDRPQPRRNLALALARRAQSAPAAQARADLARAISLLTEVVMTPWDNAYDGIEMISLVEANRLIPRYRALGGAGHRPRSAADRLARLRPARDDRMADRGERRRSVGGRAGRRARHLLQPAHARSAAGSPTT